MIILGLGVLPEFQLQGVNALFFSEIDKIFRESRFQYLDILWVTETTVRMKNDLKALGLRATHIHRAYSRELDFRFFPKGRRSALDIEGVIHDKENFTN